MSWPAGVQLKPWVEFSHAEKYSVTNIEHCQELRLRTKLTDSRVGHGAQMDGVFMKNSFIYVI